jgi:hypothetical protein
MLITTIDSGSEGTGIPGESWTKWWILEFSEPVHILDSFGNISDEAKDHIQTHCRAWSHRAYGPGTSFSSNPLIYIDNLNSDAKKRNRRALVVHNGGLDI